MTTYICLGLPANPDAVGTIEDFIKYFSRLGYQINKPPKYSELNDKKIITLYLQDGDLFWDVTPYETVNILEVDNDL